jgi:hypothetical protein
MLKKILQIWNGLFSIRQWEPFGDIETRTFMMRRWTESGWERREATLQEQHEAQDFWATK